MYVPLSTFDPAPYQRSPQLPLRAMCVLAETLAARTPELAPVYVHEAARAMTQIVAAAEAALLERLRETNETTTVADTVFDNAVDILWRMLRDGLQRWSSYAHAGLDWLDGDEELELDAGALRAKIERAQELHQRVFGAGGLDMLTRRFPEQQKAMASVLELIEADGLEPEIAAMTDPELMPILRRCQARYAEMVRLRATRESRSRTDLRVTRVELQRAIVTYASLVLTLVKADEPDSVVEVQAALLPMINMRSTRPAGSASPADLDEDTEAPADLAANE